MVFMSPTVLLKRSVLRTHIAEVDFNVIHFGVLIGISYFLECMSGARQPSVLNKSGKG